MKEEILHSVSEESTRGEQELTYETSTSSNEAPRKRIDTGRLHATRHAILSRYPLEALRSLGEDIKQFRRLERRLRAAVKPRGQIAEFFFDRFYSSYLRCLLAARLEAGMFEQARSSTKQPCALPMLRERELPTLLLPDENDERVIPAGLPPDVFRELLLVERYDSHFGKEMFRALSALLVLRVDGEAGLASCIGHMMGNKKQREE
jgi:hypothetical protein